MTDLPPPARVAAFNKAAWDALARRGNQWTIPVQQDEVQRARSGDVRVVLTPTRPVPPEWLGDLRGKSVLGLASAGGQQGPLLAAAGAHVTVLDNSPAQLGQDRLVAKREGLQITLIEGDMRDLSCLQDQSFDLVFHPCSNCFVPDVLAVWEECFRVLKPGGDLLAGFVNPVVFMMDLEQERAGHVILKYKTPFSQFDYPGDPELTRLRSDGEPIDFGHSLQDQIGGQLAAGFHLVSLFEDGWPADRSPIHALMKCYLATRARKPLTSP